MSRSHLRPCTACARHVRVTEAACPFCGASVDASLAASPAPLPPAARLSRAALFALGAGTISLTTACGGAVESNTRDDGGATTADGSSQTGDGYDGGNIAVPYGLAPPPPDSGVETVDAGPPPADAAASPDAHDAGVIIIAPPYGLPPDPQ